ncbi:MAG TPA: serine/threonine protein kinase, partial [Phycisphaerae bacterium]|nr:serine/threonine protein kinase [Phycisphaerae bacterium]
MAFHFNQGDRPLPGYTIQRGVGRGGFGEVYYATSDGGKEVALKYLRENPQVELRGVMHCLNLKSPYLVAI